MNRVTTEYCYEIPASPEAVFPLLCPVREYEWIDGWACELVYSDSGVAEDNCIFKTNFEDQPMIWSVTRYEPPQRIEFVAVTPDRVMRLCIRLEPTAQGTKLFWRRVFTSLTGKGKQQLQKWTTESEKALAEKLAHFLKTGEKLVQNHPPS